MAKYDDLKKKAKDALETLADVSAEAYRVAEEKARILAKKAKLTAEITREKGMIRRLKGELGAKYYALHMNDPEEAFAELCSGITDSYARIEAKKKEIDDLNNPGESCCSDDGECCAHDDEPQGPEGI